MYDFASHLSEAKYHGSTPAAFLPDTGKRAPHAASAGFVDLYRDTTRVFCAHHSLLSHTCLEYIYLFSTRIGCRIQPKIQVDETNSNHKQKTENHMREFIYYVSI